MLIKHKNFKLAVLGHLLKYKDFRDKVEPEFTELVEKYHKTYGDTSKPIPEIQKYLESIKITQKDLHLIRVFSPKQDDEIYKIVAPGWKGEDSQFDIESIEELDKMLYMTQFKSGKMLAKGRIKYKKLLGMLWLKSVEIDKNAAIDEKEAFIVIRKLRERGVKVKHNYDKEPNIDPKEIPFKKLPIELNATSMIIFDMTVVVLLPTVIFILAWFFALEANERSQERLIQIIFSYGVFMIAILFFGIKLGIRPKEPFFIKFDEEDIEIKYPFKNTINIKYNEIKSIEYINTKRRLGTYYSVHGIFPDIHIKFKDVDKQHIVIQQDRIIQTKTTPWSLYKSLRFLLADKNISFKEGSLYLTP